MTALEAELLAELTKEGAFPLFVTGAGISVASGIPTFRGDDPDAIWSRDVLKMGTRDMFERDPVRQWKWYLDRFESCLGCEPNPAHTALVELEQWLLANGKRFHLVTQNVDGLHVAAGTKNITEIHGAARKMRCSKRSCGNGAPRGFLSWDASKFEAFKAEPVFKNLPRCIFCRKLLRPHVLWFDETYYDHKDYGLDDLVPLIGEVTSIIFIGTSFSVGITEMISLAAYEEAIPMYVVDPNMTPKRLELDLTGAGLFAEKAEEFLPRLVSLVEG